VQRALELFVAQDRAGSKRHFDAMHEIRYGTAAPDERVEIMSLRTTVTGVMSKPPPAKIPTGGAGPPPEAFTNHATSIWTRSAGSPPHRPTPAPRSWRGTVSRALPSSNLRARVPGAGYRARAGGAGRGTVGPPRHLVEP